jgi:hypothetical protein
MYFARIFNSRHYHPEKNRFQSGAFTPASSDKCISVFSVECTSDGPAKGCVCNHIKLFYAQVAGEPVIYWVFSGSELPSGVHVNQSESKAGDVCHYNIEGFSLNAAKRFYKILFSVNGFSDHFICLGYNSAQFDPKYLY